jgi:alpha-methylacyl-CoA racemase
MLKLPNFASPPGENLVDGGAPFYNVYICADSEPEHALIAVACLELAFFVDFISRFVPIVGPDNDGWTPTPKTHARQEEWPRLKAYLTHGFATRPRDFWTEFFKGCWSIYRFYLLLTPAAFDI